MTIRLPTLAHHRTEGTHALGYRLPAVCLFADTIMRTSELGVTITDAAVDEKTTSNFLHAGDA